MATILLYNSSREVGIDDYPEELLVTLRRAVEDIQARNAWQPGDAVRLIFHVFKPLRDVEAQAVKRLIERLTDFRVEFAFLHGVRITIRWPLTCKKRERRTGDRQSTGSAERLGRTRP